MQLSIRMRAVADCVEKGDRIADIGTDHGYVPIYLIQNNIATQAIAMDVRKGPLSHADQNILKYGLNHKIETRLSDGLKELKADEADTVIIAGMGGLLMNRILSEGIETLDTVKKLVLQPQSDIEEVRRYLHEKGYYIQRENMVIDDHKFYVIIQAGHGQDVVYTKIDYLFGKCLLDEKHPILKAYLEKEKIHLEQIINTLKQQTSNKSKQRLDEMLIELEWVCEAINRMEMR